MQKSGSIIAVIVILIFMAVSVRWRSSVQQTVNGVDMSPDLGFDLAAPLSFIQNQGQAPDEVKFHTSAAGHTISFTPGAVILRSTQGGARPRHCRG